MVLEVSGFVTALHILAPGMHCPLLYMHGAGRSCGLPGLPAGLFHAALLFPLLLAKVVSRSDLHYMLCMLS